MEGDEESEAGLDIACLEAEKELRTPSERIMRENLEVRLGLGLGLRS